MIALLLRGESIPEEIRPDIITALDRNAGALTWNPADLQYLFEVYNRYVAPAGEPEKINCGGCRSKVIGKLRQYARAWTES